MKFLFSILILLVLPGFVSSQSTKIRNTQANCEPFIYERLRNYFEVNEVKPTQEINNTYDLGLWASKTEKIKVGEHVVEWIDVVEKTTFQASININGEKIELKDQSTANVPDEDNKFSANMADRWDTIKLYEFDDQTIIGISMSSRICTGLSCSVGIQMWYDLKSKQITFFGTFRTDGDVRLFRFPREEAIFTISTNFKGDSHGVTNPAEITYKLYKLNPDGRFTIQRNVKGQDFYIYHKIFPDRMLKGENIVPRKKKCEQLKQNWLEDVLEMN
ncbi:MAG TPA: hypothetical protein PKA82_01015 [Pyrinomonadaceae bacterium]|nr:hypothetical protein [Pyrinomonadaceae bacterium]